VKKILVIIVILSICLFVSNESISKGVGGGGFRGGGYGNSSKVVPTTPTGGYGNSSKVAPTTNVQTKPEKSGYGNTSGSNVIKNTPQPQKSFFTSSINKKVSAEQSKAATIKYEQQKSQFKIAPTPIDKSRYSSTSPIMNESIKYNPRNYTVRREIILKDYTPPSYIYNMPPRIGVYDTLFLGMMFANINNASYMNTYYTNRNDPDMMEWRREMEKQAATDAELKAKLIEMDNKVKKLESEGVVVDSNYTPDGIDKDLMFSKDALDELKKKDIIPESEESDTNWISIFITIFIISGIVGLFIAYMVKKSRNNNNTPNYTL